MEPTHRHFFEASPSHIAPASATLFLLVNAYGEFMNGAPNSACYPYLGCDSGFFGYDALEHFLFGFAAVWLLVWFFRKYPRYSLLHSTFWKSAMSILAMVAFIAVIWEMLECFRDAYLLDLAHAQLLDFKLRLNLLAQPSNIDTMGDLTFTLLGVLLAFPFLRRRSTQADNPSSTPSNIS